MWGIVGYNKNFNFLKNGVGNQWRIFRCDLTYILKRSFWIVFTDAIARVNKLLRRYGNNPDKQ